MFKRYLKEQVAQDLCKKMVFLGGPRQVGKTTLAKDLLPHQNGYLNWDIPEHQEAILKQQWPAVDFLVLDEIHKYRLWRQLIKGLYDKNLKEQKILVTGNARLDYYRYGGDSLQGRYFYLRMHPLSYAEVIANNVAISLQDLLALGGFPEPFFTGSQTDAKRWSREYRQRLLQEDLASIEDVQNVGQLELLMLRLPELVGSTLSVTALREDLQVSHITVSNWLAIFERLYAIFRIAPFGAPKIRAIKKSQKHYQMDWTLVPTEPEKFENLVACGLLKWVHYQQDCLGEDVDLKYFRDVDGREVDFVLVKGKNPTHFIECKWSDREPSAALHYLKTRFTQAEAWQISAVGTKDFVTSRGARVCPATIFLKNLI